MRYDSVMVFRKSDDMSSYYNTVKNSRHGLLKWRDVDLRLYIRFEDGKIFGRIQCPINPFPFKGDCELVSITVICNALESFGWKYVTAVPLPKN